MNLPNAITLSRLFLVLPFGYLLFAGHSRWVLLAVFGLAAATDWLDGFVARRLGRVTPEGAALDQLVDRVFTVLIVLLLLTHAYLVDGGPSLETARRARGLPLLLGLSCTREIVGLPGVVIALVRRRPLYHVESVGKLATFVQCATLGAILLEVPWALELASACALVGAVAGATYVRYALGRHSEA